MFKNAAAEFVYYRTYSRWQDNLGRRETWEETVDRVINFFKEERGSLVPPRLGIFGLRLWFTIKGSI